MNCFAKIISIVGSIALAAGAHAQGACSLSGDVGRISLSAGGVQRLEISTDRPNDYYAMLGSTTGTSPGFALSPWASFDLVADGYTVALLHGRYAALARGYGFTDENGEARDAVVIPAGTDPSLAGVTLYHAYYFVDHVTLLQTCASNTVAVQLVP